MLKVTYNIIINNNISIYTINMVISTNNSNNINNHKYIHNKYNNKIDSNNIIKMTKCKSLNMIITNSNK